MNQNGFGLILVLLLIFISIGGILAGVVLTQRPQTLTPKALETTVPVDPELNSIRSVTFFIENRNSPSQIKEDLTRDLQNIKAHGFNTVLLVSGWSRFNPKPLANPPVYNQAAFDDLKAILALLKSNNMKAILPLNYLEGGAPEGIINLPPGSQPRCDFLANEVKFNSFVAYVTEYLTQIQEYSGMVYPMVFSENSECNIANYDWTNPAKRKELTQLLRSTLGNIPSKLPITLRSKFIFGYYDAAIVRHMVQSGETGDTPIAKPNPFNFLATGGYYVEGEHSDQEIVSSVSSAINEFRRSFPTEPLLIFEFGQSTCPQTKKYANLSLEENQTRVLTTQVKLFKSLNLGFNIWGWTDTSYSGNCPVFAGSTVVNEGYGLGLTQANQSFKPALTALQQVLVEDNPPIGADGGSNCNQLIGWACDPNDFSRDLDVHFYQDGPAYGTAKGNLLTGTKANKEINQAVSQYCGGKLAKWYQLPTPESLKDGKSHSLYIYPINYPPTPGKQNPQVTSSPITLNCPKPSPSILISSPTPSPISSPSVTPTPSNRTGDLNHDGKIDIFDFNIFLQDYRTGNLRSDINNDQKVDIFDFNLLLAGFGK